MQPVTILPPPSAGWDTSDDHNYSCPAAVGRPCALHGSDFTPHLGDMEIRACIEEGDSVTSGVAEDEAQFWTVYSADRDGLWMAVEDYDSREEAREVMAESLVATPQPDARYRNSMRGQLRTAGWTAGEIDQLYVGTDEEDTARLEEKVIEARELGYID